jgi:uncharacterized surface protein with fasciclin (FAS1) repeats
MANIVKTAEDAGTFTTLVRAVKAAGLEKALSEQGPYTVFAQRMKPLPNCLRYGRKPAQDKRQLKGILTYHVVQDR